MRFHQYVPHGRLREFVDDLWLYEDYAGAHPRERILPSGTFEMVFNLREDELRIYGPSDSNECRRFAGALVSGPYSRWFTSDRAEEAAIMGVHFKPGAAAAFLGLPASELADTHVELEAIWGRSATILREQLCSLTEPTRRFRLIEQALTKRLCDAPRRHHAVRVALDVLIRTHGRAKVRDLAKAVDLSRRRLVEAFTRDVGLTPKLFGRVRRFQHAIVLSRSAAKIDWAQIAAECAYFDQSHLIHEFAEFSGATPADFRRRLSELDRAGAHVKRHHLPWAA